MSNMSVSNELKTLADNNSDTFSLSGFTASIGYALGDIGDQAKVLEQSISSGVESLSNMADETADKLFDVLKESGFEIDDNVRARIKDCVPYGAAITAAVLLNYLGAFSTLPTSTLGVAGSGVAASDVVKFSNVHDVRVQRTIALTIKASMNYIGNFESWTHVTEESLQESITEFFKALQCFGDDLVGSAASGAIYSLPTVISDNKLKAKIAAIINAAAAAAS